MYIIPPLKGGIPYKRSSVGLAQKELAPTLSTAFYWLYTIDKLLDQTETAFSSFVKADNVYQIFHIFS